MDAIGIGTAVSIVTGAGFGFGYLVKRYDKLRDDMACRQDKLREDMNAHVSSLSSRIEIVEEHADEIVLNYRDRFDAVRQDLADWNIKQINAINDLKLLVQHLVDKSGT